jgi:hypothetical protein
VLENNADIMQLLAQTEPQTDEDPRTFIAHTNFALIDVEAALRMERQLAPTILLPEDMSGFKCTNLFVLSVRNDFDMDCKFVCVIYN